MSGQDKEKFSDIPLWSSKTRMDSRSEGTTDIERGDNVLRKVTCRSRFEGWEEDHLRTELIHKTFINVIT